MQEIAKWVFIHPVWAHSYSLIYFRYIEFYLDLVTSSDNIALLYHLALKAKTVRDSESHTYSEVRRFPPDW